jgi:hypothetical protein
VSTGTTITCVCGSQGFLVVDAATGEPVDLKTFYATKRSQFINPDDLKRHNPLDTSALKMVCANPNCRRVLGTA